jgi:hypothetical protein
VYRALHTDTFHKNKNISGSPPVVTGPLDDVNYGDELDGFYVVKGLPLVGPD